MKTLEFVRAPISNIKVAGRDYIAYVLFLVFLRRQNGRLIRLKQTAPLWGSDASGQNDCGAVVCLQRRADAQADLLRTSA